jgi:uncharacterized protein (TIGR00369 family)
MPTAKMTIDEMVTIFRKSFGNWDSSGVLIEHAAYREARVRITAGEQSLRPGGTVSGPSMFALADTALYVAVLASVGPKLLAVTTNMSINFLRKPAPGDIIAECRLIKLGKRLAIGDVFIHSQALSEPVAHAVGTYSIPE